MDISFSKEERAFQAEVREFLATAVPAEIATKVDAEIEHEKKDVERWQAILHAQGWLAYSWPVEYGGTGWGPVKRFIFENELACANSPFINVFAFKMLGPVLIEFGSDQQKQYWLPRMLDCSDWWCQGFSEPGAGSDLASLRTSAVRDGDDYIVNGQKTWTTLGQHANMIFCLVRTSTEGRPQHGISFLMIDLATPGIEMRPIKLIDGGHEVNEVFFTDVRVPGANLVGEENMGWTYAKFLLVQERYNIANVGAANHKLSRLLELAKTRMRRGQPLANDPLFALRLARVEIALKNMETTNLRVLSDVASGASAGAGSSMLKILGSEIMQEIDSLMRRALGSAAQAVTPEVFAPDFTGETVAPVGRSHATATYFNHRKLSIFAGSNEIQKNIITKITLGL